MLADFGTKVNPQAVRHAQVNVDHLGVKLCSCTALYFVLGRSNATPHCRGRPNRYE